VDEYASLGEGDDLSRRTTPAFFELESDHEGKNERGSTGVFHIEQQMSNGGSGADVAISADVYGIDLDNGDDEQLQAQPLTAHRMVSAGSTVRRDERQPSTVTNA
jgi:hypothetical protein